MDSRYSSKLRSSYIFDCDWYVMYKYFGIALLGIFATMLIPINAESTNTASAFYGIAHVTTWDAAGNPTSTQSVHNALINLGEAFIIDQVFQEGNTPATLPEAEQIASICISEDATYVDAGPAEDNTETVAQFDASDGTTLLNCIEDTAVSDASVGIAVIDSGVTFDAGTHADQDATYTVIGICPGHATLTEFATCAAAGDGTNPVLFALVDITDFVLGAGESATITYTFDVDEEA